MAERTDEPSSAIHLQVAGRPGDRRADVAREDRVIVRELADDPVHVLRVDDLAAGSAFRQGVEATGSRANAEH
jgi:hypothetical protein